MRKTHNIDWSYLTYASFMLSVLLLVASIVFYNTVNIIYPSINTRIRDNGIDGYSQAEINAFFEQLDHATAFLDDYRIVGIVGYPEYDLVQENKIATETSEEEVITPIEEEVIVEETSSDVSEVVEQEVVEEVVQPVSVSYETTTTIPYSEYIIKSGDSLYKIAIQFYGDGSAYPFIEKCNNLYGNNRTLIPGQTLRIYPLDYAISESEIEENGIAKERSLRSKYLDIPDEIDYSNLTYVGKFPVTGYDPYCSHCCGKADGITASGEQITEFYKTVACNALPFGTKVYVEGYGYFTVNDTGGSKVGIDIACESHDACATMSKAGVEVYIVN